MSDERTLTIKLPLEEELVTAIIKAKCAYFENDIDFDIHGVYQNQNKTKVIITCNFIEAWDVWQEEYNVIKTENQMTLEFDHEFYGELDSAWENIMYWSRAYKIEMEGK